MAGYPLLDLELFRSPRFSAALGISVASGVVMAGVSLQATVFLQVVAELSPVAPGGVGLLVAGLTVTSAGIALPMALTMNLMMVAATPERAGSVASQLRWTCSRRGTRV